MSGLRQMTSERVFLCAAVSKAAGVQGYRVKMHN